MAAPLQLSQNIEISWFKCLVGSKRTNQLRRREGGGGRVVSEGVREGGRVVSEGVREVEEKVLTLPLLRMAASLSLSFSTLWLKSA